jgi:hypothetical protein
MMTACPFFFSLEVSPFDDHLYYGWFDVSNEFAPDIGDCYEYPDHKFDVTEGNKRPAGKPVYATAEGIFRYSGTAGGYGWLIFIDHP